MLIARFFAHQNKMMTDDEYDRKKVKMCAEASNTANTVTVGVFPRCGDEALLKTL